MDSLHLARPTVVVLSYIDYRTLDLGLKSPRVARIFFRILEGIGVDMILFALGYRKGNSVPFQRQHA
jgi:hypothetical protein